MTAKATTPEQDSSSVWENCKTNFCRPSSWTFKTCPWKWDQDSPERYLKYQLNLDLIAGPESSKITTVSWNRQYAGVIEITIPLETNPYHNSWIKERDLAGTPLYSSKHQQWSISWNERTLHPVLKGACCHTQQLLMLIKSLFYSPEYKTMNKFKFGPKLSSNFTNKPHTCKNLITSNLPYSHPNQNERTAFKTYTQYVATDHRLRNIFLFSHSSHSLHIIQFTEVAHNVIRVPSLQVLTSCPWIPKRQSKQRQPHFIFKVLIELQNYPRQITGHTRPRDTYRHIIHSMAPIRWRHFQAPLATAAAWLHSRAAWSSC